MTIPSAAIPASQSETAVVSQAARLRKMAAIKREAAALLAPDYFQLGDRVGLEAIFERALASLRMVYQPIVCWSRREIYAQEALVRSNESGAPTPAAIFHAA